MVQRHTEDRNGIFFHDDSLSEGSSALLQGLWISLMECQLQELRAEPLLSDLTST